MKFHFSKFFLLLSSVVPIFFVSVRFRMTRQFSKVITFEEMESRCFFFSTGFFQSAMIARTETFILSKFHNRCQVEFSFLLIQDVYHPYLALVLVCPQMAWLGKTFLPTRKCKIMQFYCFQINLIIALIISASHLCD